MTELEKFYEVLTKYRLQFGLMVHTRSDERGTRIEVHSGKDLVLLENQADPDNAYCNAKNDLIEWVGWRLAEEVT